ncbi:MAG: response regulator [Candidatus Binataceae bacterium]
MHGSKDGWPEIADTDAVEADRIAHLLRSGFALVTLWVLGDIGQCFLLNPSRAYAAAPYDLLRLSACLAVAGITYRREFASYWRETTLALGLFLAAAETFSGVMLGGQAPTFVTILVLLTASYGLVPWEPGWQRALTSGFLAAALTDTVMVRPVSPYIGLLWVATLASCALALAGNQLWAESRRARTYRAKQGAVRLRAVFDADLGRASAVQFGGGRFIYVNEELIANLSHQLRNSLNAIAGMADLLAESPLTADQRAYVDSVATSSSTLMDLINVILDLAKLESGKLRLENKEFDLEESMARLAETLRVKAHEKGLELAVRIRPYVPQRVAGDPLRLCQVLSNLVENAIKFTEHGEVLLTVENLRARHETAELRFTVKDTGIGIPPEAIKTIFQAFLQGDSSGREYEGSGLGLSIAKRLVELMGGQIEVESARGVGSIFSFSAAFGVRAGSTAPEATAPEATAPEDPSAKTLQGWRVLVVDDNDTNRMILREFLTSRGAEVVEADDGSPALDELRRARTAGEPYKLVLLDCRMPTTDGFEVAQHLRGEAGGAESIVLMVTSDGLDATLARMRELGIGAYVVKPVGHAELLRAIGVATGTAAAVEAKPAQAPPPERELPALECSGGILLVDDSAQNRLLVKQYLKGLPYQVDMAENGEVALEKFLRGHYDLVLMDLRMPVMDGHMAVRRIREWEQQQKRTPTPIVALSASALERDVSESLETGCTAHISKPVRKARLLAVVRELINGNGVHSNGSRHDQPADSAPVPPVKLQNG